MTDFLGIPITYLMIALLALLAVALLSVALVWVRNPILFDIGLRNIPRRRAQSVLIVVGLMLSTVIVSAAFATGDTVNYSITNDTYEKLGRVDEIIQVRANTKAPSLTQEQILPAGTISRANQDELTADVNGNDDVDGFLPGLRFPAPVQNEDTQGIEPEVVIIGLDQRRLTGFEDDIITPTGATYPVQQLQRNEALANVSLRDALGLKPGDRVNIFIGNVPRTVTIAGIVQDKFLTGWTQGQPNGLVVPITTAQFLYGRQDVAGFIAVSNRGGVRDAGGLSGKVSQFIVDAFGPSRLEVSQVKRDRIERAKELGSNMAAIFVVLGLFSIASGLLLVFLILVMLSAERRPEMGMSRAVGMKRLQLIEAFMAEGMAYSVTSALAGAALGVAVSLAMTRAMQYIFNRFDVAITFHVTWQSLTVAYCLGVVLTFLTVVISAWRVSNLSIVAAIREVDEAAPRATGVRTAIFGGALAAGGLALTGWGLAGNSAYLFGTGLSLALMGGAFVARSFAAPERLLLTATGIGVLALWALVAGDQLRPVTGSLNPGLDTFFVGGVLMVAAATFVVIYNAELLMSVMRGVGVVFSRAVPAVRTSIAYPLANKFRTGMTIAMMSLVVFALVMISTMNVNFRRLFLSDDSRGGWDVQVQALPVDSFDQNANGNPLGPLGEALARGLCQQVNNLGANCAYDTGTIESIAQVSVANERTTQIAELKGGQEQERKPFKIIGADRTFLEQNTIGLQARAAGFESDRAVWDAVRDEPSNAVIDGSVVPGINYANVTESRFTLSNYESGTRRFTPFPMMISETGTNKVKPVRIIGIMNRGPSETYAGIWINSNALGQDFTAAFDQYYIRLQPGADAQAEAKAMERILGQYGVTAKSIKREVEKSQALSSAFFYLVQGFMGLGLIVGLAALGVIAFRTVVERRQQIGLMRAIGFSRTNVALTFLLESAFIAVLGIVNGVWLALLLADRLLSSRAFSTAGFTSFYVPWLQIVLMAAGVFLASVLTTLIPSRQASSIPIAEALRYE